jgi:hypothetical protein
MEKITMRKLESCASIPEPNSDAKTTSSTAELTAEQIAFAKVVGIALAKNWLEEHPTPSSSDTSVHSC